MKQLIDSCHPISNNATIFSVLKSTFLKIPRSKPIKTNPIEIKNDDGTWSLTERKDIKSGNVFREIKIDGSKGLEYRAAYGAVWKDRNDSPEFGDGGWVIGVYD